MRQETFDKLAPWLKAAVKHTNGTHLLEDVIKAFSEGGCTLWVGKACFAITEFTTYPRKTVMNVWLAGGDLTERADLQHGMEAFARGRGAVGLSFMGRITPAVEKACGWAKYADCKPLWVYYYKDLTP